MEKYKYHYSITNGINKNPNHSIQTINKMDKDVLLFKLYRYKKDEYSRNLMKTSYVKAREMELYPFY